MLASSISDSPVVAASRYGLVAIAFHWLIALAIAAMFALGMFMTSLVLSPDKLRYYAWHKWAGVSIFVMVALRLAWRLAHERPNVSARGRAWQRTAAKWNHVLLYVLMFTVPVSGWLMSSAKGVSTVYFGMWALPDVVTPNVDLGRRLQSAHVALNYVLASAVTIHIGAALKHHLWDGDDVLVHMLPFLRTRRWRPS